MEMLVQRSNIHSAKQLHPQFRKATTAMLRVLKGGEREGGREGLGQIVWGELDDEE